MVCGPGKWGDRIVPDEPLGAADFTICCAYHDYGYAEPGQRSRKEIDREFRKCMLKSAMTGERPRLAAILARIYYRAVRLGGWFGWWRERHKKTNGRPKALGGSRGSPHA